MNAVRLSFFALLFVGFSQHVIGMQGWWGNEPRLFTFNALPISKEANAFWAHPVSPHEELEKQRDASSPTPHYCTDTIEIVDVSSYIIEIVKVSDGKVIEVLGSYECDSSQ